MAGTMDPEDTPTGAQRPTGDHPGPCSRIAALTRRSIAHPIARVLGIVLVSRAVLVGLLMTLRVVLPDEVRGSVASLLCRWDCGHYVRIAADGYTIPAEAGDALPHAFFPLFPLLVGLVSELTSVTPLIAGVALANGLFGLAMVYVYYYSRDLGFSQRAALLGVALLAFAPPTIVFSAPMTESLFVLLLAAAVFHLRRGHYLVAGVAAALLSATRPNGLVFVAFGVIWLVRDLGWRAFLRPWERPAALLPVVLAPVGLFAYWAYSFATTGDAFAHLTTNRQGWGWGTTGPLEMLGLIPRLEPYDWILIMIGLLALAISLLLLRYRLYAEFGLVIASLAFYWSGGLAPVSMARFALVLFPLAVILGRVLADRPIWAGVALGAAGTFSGLVTTVGWAMREFVV